MSTTSVKVVRPNFNGWLAGLKTGDGAAITTRMVGTFREQLRTTYHDLRTNVLSTPELDINLASKDSIAKLRGEWDSNTVEGLHQTNLYRFNSTILLSIFTILNNSAMLYLGPPGFSKTYLMELLGNRVYGYPIDWIQAGIIYGNKELTQDDVAAYFDLPKLMKGKTELHKHVFAHLRYRGFDEITRTPPALLAFFFSMLDRGYSVRAGRHIRLNPGPFFATANKKDEGSFPLPTPLFDRFGLVTIAQGLNPENIHRLADKGRRSKVRESLTSESTFSSNKMMNPEEVKKMIEDHPASLLAAEKIRQAQQEIDMVSIPPEMVYIIKFLLNSLNYCQFLGDEARPESRSKTSLQFARQPLIKLCEDKRCALKKTGVCFETENTLSVRAQQTLIDMARTFAWWLGAQEPSLIMAAELFPFIASHRINPTDRVHEDYINDRFKWTRHMWDTVESQFTQINAEHKNILAKYYQLIEELEKNIRRNKKEVSQLNAKIAEIHNGIKKIPSVAQFPMLIKLEDLAGRLKAE